MATKSGEKYLGINDLMCRTNARSRTVSHCRRNDDATRCELIASVHTFVDHPYRQNLQSNSFRV